MNKTRRRFSFLPSKGHIGLILLLSYLIFFRSCQQYNLFINEVARSSQKNICACAPISKLKKLSEHHDFKKVHSKPNLTQTCSMKSKSNAWVSSVGTIQRAVVQEIQVLLYSQYEKWKIFMQIEQFIAGQQRLLAKIRKFNAQR